MSQRILAIDAWEYKATDGTFTVADLHKQYNRICNPNDWRAPIDAIVPKAEVLITVAAITYYTGTTCKTHLVDAPDGYSGEFWRIRSVGYRNGPCGP